MKQAIKARTAFRLLPFAFCLCSACQQQMASQPSYKPDEPSSFFPDGRSGRPLVAGTVARGHLRTDLHLFAGKRVREDTNWARPAGFVGIGTQGVFGGIAAAAVEANEYANYVDTFPFAVGRDVLEKGHDRYIIYCVVCHDPLGTGRGKIVERGYTPPPTYHSDRLRAAPVGHFFDVVTNGYGSMPDYKQQIPPRDRWAIVAYVRALQLSQHFPREKLTDAMRRELERAANRGGQEP